MEDTLLVRFPTKLKIKHLQAYVVLEEKIPPINKMLKVVENITEVEQVNDIVLEDLVRLYKRCLSIMEKVNYNEKLPKKIKILNKEYYLVNPLKQPISWVIDSNALVTENKPEMIAAFMYIDEGTVYGEVDVNKNIKNSVIDRSMIFKEHFPLGVQLALITKFSEVIKDFNSIFDSGKEKSNTKQSSYAWEDLMLRVGKHFSMGFHEVMQLNAKTFKHYTDVYFDFLKKENARKIK